MEEDLYREKIIYGSIFFFANRLQVVMDRFLREQGITSKQWFLTVTIQEFFKEPPTLNEVSRAMGSSYQNVKQLALKLEEKGFLKIEKDSKDRRVLRLKLTQESQIFWESREDESKNFLLSFFKGLSQEELNYMYSGFEKLGENLERLDETIGGKK